MKKLSILLCLMAVIACKKEVKEELPVFYTHEARIAQSQNQHSDFPMPKLVDYYSTHNFVVDSLGGLYYFQHDTPIIPGCGTGYDEDTYPAKFINLKPEKLIKISPSGIEEFVKRKIITDTVRHNLRIICVGSEKDTFYSQDFSKFLELLPARVHLVFIRHTSQEESEVLNHKKRKIPYDYHLIKWDSARTTFRNHIQ